MKLIIPKVCSVCGRRGINGTSHCELHPPRPRPTEAERLITEPYRSGYRDPEYLRLRPIVIAEARGTCEICGRRFGDETPMVDHKIPLSDGGANVRSNLQAACAICNQKKKAADRRARRERQ